MKRIKRAVLVLGALGMLSILGAMVQTAQAGCGKSDRMKASRAQCLHITEEERTWDYRFSAINLCSPLGRVVGKVDVEDAGDKTFYLDGAGWESQTSIGDARGKYCCTDGNSFCNVSDRISTQKCQTAYNASPAADKRCRNGTATWVATGGNEGEALRVNFSCGVTAQCIMRDGSWQQLTNYKGHARDGGAITPEKLRKMDFYDGGSVIHGKAVSYPDRRVSPSRYNCGNHYCNVGDCRWHWNRSPAVKNSKCVRWEGDAHTRRFIDITMDGQDGRSSSCDISVECGYVISPTRIQWKRATVRASVWYVDDMQWCSDNTLKTRC